MESRKYKYIYFGAKLESEIEFENLKEEEFDNPEVIVRFTKEYKETTSTEKNGTIVSFIPDEQIFKNFKYTINQKYCIFCNLLGMNLLQINFNTF